MLIGRTWLMRLATLGTLTGLALGGVAGWQLADALGAKRLAQCEHARADERAKAATAAARRLQAAQAAADTAVRQEAARRHAAEHQTRETQRALYRLTTGRPCLSGPAVGLLNAAPGIAPERLPQPAGGPAHPPAAAAAHPGQPGASDRDVAGWIADAAGQYDACRGRIDALRAWSEAIAHGRD